MKKLTSNFTLPLLILFLLLGGCGSKSKKKAYTRPPSREKKQTFIEINIDDEFFVELTHATIQNGGTKKDCHYIVAIPGTTQKFKILCDCSRINLSNPPANMQLHVHHDEKGNEGDPDGSTKGGSSEKEISEPNPNPQNKK